MFSKLNLEPNNNCKLEEKNNNNPNNQNNIKENISNQDELSKLIKEIPINNLNDYYDIETNLFKKRIEKLNLKFYWIYESILGEDSNNNLVYPYNKLFLILFKEISLYIEEILRLNKQLNLKNKNEKFYIQKLNDYKQKEKDFIQGKQLIKAMERNIKNLEKNNEKLKKEIDKLNQKLHHSNGSSFNSKSNFSMYKNNLSKNGKFANFNQISNKFYNYNVTEQGSVLSSGSNKLQNKTSLINKRNNSKEMTGNFTSNRINSNSSIYTKTTNISVGNNNKDLIYLGINQCADEIDNLEIIEKFLMNFYEKKNNNNKIEKKTIKSCKILSPERCSINKLVKFTSYRKNLYKSKIKKNNTNTNKSIDYKSSNIIISTNNFQ